MRIVVSEFLSQDGVMEVPGGSEGYQQGGWALRWHDPEIDEHTKDELFAADALLLGRVTYEAFRPSLAVEDRRRRRRRPDEPHPQVRGVVDVEDDPVEQLAPALGRRHRRGHRAPAPPGPRPARRRPRHPGALARHELVDLYRFTVYPVALGNGKRLFEGERVDLNLVGHRSISTGVLLTSYRPATAAKEQVA
jgi:dihydrofolate reductase